MDGQHNDGLTSLDNDDATTTWKWDDDDGAMMPKTITTQDDNPTPFLSHSPHAKQDQDKNTARTNYKVARCCEVLTDNDVNVWRAKEELSVRVMV